MKVIVASKNPGKIEGAKLAFAEYFKEFEIEVLPMKFSIGGKSYFDGEMSNDKFYKKISKSKVINKEQPFYMGCYGIGVSRVLGLVYENNTIKENNQVIGYSLPLSVTPYYLTIIYHETRKETSQEIYNQFIKNDIPVIIDDTNATIGEKIRNAKILGIPYIAILGKNTKDTEVELEKTKDNQKEIMDINTLYTTIEHLKQTKEEYHFNN